MSPEPSAPPNPAPQPPPQVLLYHLATGHYLSNALHLTAKLGIADRLHEGPRNAEDIAGAMGLHAPSLRRVMRLLASVGVFEEQQDGSFALTELGGCLRSGVPGSARAMVMLFAGDRIQEAWRELEYCIRTGNPAFRKRGIDDPFKDPARSPEESDNFDAAMADLTRLAAVAVAAAYDFGSVRTVADVGGGNGALLIGILKANPHLHGIVFDQADAAERAAKQIADNDLADRCTAVGGDFFTAVPDGADVYMLKHVIHDWDDDRALVILRNCHRAMPGDGRLLILEAIYPPRVDQSLASRGAARNDVNMLVNTGGRQRSEAEFRTLYGAAGLTLTRIVPTEARLSVIEGRRA